MKYAFKFIIEIFKFLHFLRFFYLKIRAFENIFFTKFVRVKTSYTFKI